MKIAVLIVSLILIAVSLAVLGQTVAPQKVFENASVRVEVWSVKPQRAHARDEMVRKFGGTMARNDFGQDFLLHKLRRPVADRSFLSRQKFFDFVVIERVHILRPG